MGESATISSRCPGSVLCVLIWALLLSLIGGGIYFMLPEDADLVIVPFTHPLPMRAWVHPVPAKVVVALATVGGRVDYLLKSLPTVLNQVRGCGQEQLWGAGMPMLRRISACVDVPPKSTT